MRRALLLLVLLLLQPDRVLLAQRPVTFPSVGDDSAPGPPNQATRVAETHPATLAFAGAVGGAIGLLGGAIAGAKITEDDCEDCALLGGVYGAVAGGSTGLALGVHLANGSRGRFLPSLLTSLALGGAGLGMAVLSDTPEIMIAVPVAQLVSTILIERSTSSRPSP